MCLCVDTHCCTQVLSEARRVSGSWELELEEAVIFQTVVLGLNSDPLTAEISPGPLGSTSHP